MALLADAEQLLKPSGLSLNQVAILALLAETGTLEEALAMRRAVIQAVSEHPALTATVVRALWALSCGAYTAGEVAQRAGLPQSTAFTALTALCAANLACSSETPKDDGRCHHYGLTLSDKKTLLRY